jgi:aryl-alcohol dehydrogenase-like predicted oxidoreductase
LFSISAAFVLSHPIVASAVFGATKVWQLQEVIEATNTSMTADIMLEINEIHARYPNPCP